MSSSDHNIPLLPAPRELRFDGGCLSLNGAEIVIPSSASEEDRFAADSLQSLLLDRTGIKLEVTDSPEGKARIILRNTGGSDPIPVPCEQTGPESREGYSIRISSGGAELIGNSSAGLFYAVQTLAQLVQASENGWCVPEVEIRDWPELPYRGVMIDISHGPLPTVQEFERYVDFLARWKANQIYLYTEASVEMDGYSIVNHDARMSKADVRRTVEYAKKRYIDIVPNIDPYGHMHDLLRIEKYSHLGTSPHGPELDPTKPEQFAFLDDWIDQFAELFPSPFVHIGMDEVWQIERSAKAVGKTPDILFTEQINHITARFQSHGKTVMAWADMIVKYPGTFDTLPKDLIGVAWAYDAIPNTAMFLDPLAARNMPHLIQTAVANWREIALDYDLTCTNVDNFLIAGRKSGSMGLIHSVWTDNGQCFLRLSFPAMAYGVMAAWQDTPMDQGSFFEQYTNLMYPPKIAASLALALDAMNKSQISLQKVFGQSTMVEFWSDPFSENMMAKTRAHREDFRQTRLLAEESLEHLYRAQELGGDAEMIAPLVVAARQLDYMAYKYMNACEIDDLWTELGPHPEKVQTWLNFQSEVTYFSHGRFCDLMDEIMELKEAYRKEWLAEYTPFRLGAVLGRWDAEFEYNRKTQECLRVFLRDFDFENNILPPLKSVLSEIHG